MTTTTQDSALSTQHSFYPLVLLLFVGSGCSALIYEVVWLQMLQLVIGASGVSLGVLLGTYMGGMCLGSLLMPRLTAARRHPLRVYALLELGIGAIGVLLLFAMPYVDRVYVASLGDGQMSLLLRGVVCAVCLLPPTFLMGATLPAIARWVESTPRGLSWLGLFYGANIVGAVIGCLAAGFYLLPVYDMAIATYVAAGINFAVAVVGMGMSWSTGHPLQEAGTEGNHEARRHEGTQARSDVPPLCLRASVPLCLSSWPIYLAIALSGMSALGAEVIWTRLLSLLLGATVYTFSIILAVFLVGLGIGSAVGAMLTRSMSARAMLGTCQALLALAIAWSAWIITRSLPYWPVQPSLSLGRWYDFQLDLARCAWAVLPAAVLWGASFPAALAAAAHEGRDAGRTAGGVYAANTLGAIVGALAFSMWVIPAFGSQNGQRALIAIAALGACVMTWPMASNPGRRVMPLLGELAACVALIFTVPSVPWELIAYGRYMPSKLEQATVVYAGEGMNSSVAVTERSDGAMCFHVSGKIEASSDPMDMRLQRMLGHIPALIHPKPRSVLVVGCGAGVTAGCFVVHPETERIVICELEPLIPKVVAKYFTTENYFVLESPRVHVVYDDARHYVLTTQEKFDIITSDPIHPWVKGAATLYTKEYFEMCKHRLNPGGVVTQWVPLYESTPEVVKSEIRTFFEVFPHGTIWSNDSRGAGYDIVLLGQVEPMRIDVDALQERLGRQDHFPVADSLVDVGFHSTYELLASYAGQASDLGDWLKDAQVNSDRNLRLQYLAGMGLNFDQSPQIFDSMMLHYKFPQDIFVASPRAREALAVELAKRHLRSAKH